MNYIRLQQIILLHKTTIAYLLLLVTSIACISSKKDEMETPAFTNILIKETSPYLLQHAHNPVDWMPWNDTALSLAKTENKLLLISIGYAACHWCHVMEHENFEDPKVAKVMNDKFINIKVDREERPDIDQIYMDALQLMTGSGGWPLHIIALPDGRPVWGGTYFKKENWIAVLNQIYDLYQIQPLKLLTYAKKLEKGMQSMALVDPNTDTVEWNASIIRQAVLDWSIHFDQEYGGTKQAPKFMMPTQYHFLLRYAHQAQDPDVMRHVLLTLDQIAFGGVYDQLGGGFSRYAVDTKWHIPHFEKMLYDNAQLVSLYADAFLITKNPLYREVVYETLDFVSNTLTHANGAFYSSLDADSLTQKGELEEGAFYSWSEEELKTLLGTDYDMFSKYYNVNSYGFWEKGNYILIKNMTDEQFCSSQSISLKVLTQKKQVWKEKLLLVRSRRAKPRLDDKSLTSWNALMLQGYLDAYRVFGELIFLKAAKNNAEFLLKTQLKSDFSLYRTYKNGKSTISAFLEDYAITIKSFLSLYQLTFDPKWLVVAERLTEYTQTHFYDPDSKLYYFSSDLDPKLVTRSIETTDQVIASSNSVMAQNLYLLWHFTHKAVYRSRSENMLRRILPEIQKYPSSHANWLDLMVDFVFPFYEVVFVGDKAQDLRSKLDQTYIPNKLVAGSKCESQAPLLKNRFVPNSSLIYICVDNSCKYPVKTTQEALALMQKNQSLYKKNAN